uniref:KH domain-containing protein n=1 Tax=Caenorhabditis tropicalis TaxID=1561998 RepID=A0A1I7U0A2_9PELO
MIHCRFSPSSLHHTFFHATVLVVLSTFIDLCLAHLTLQRVSSSTDPSSSTGEPQNPPEEASNENQRARRRRRSPSPRRDYSRHSRSPRDRSRTPSRDSRHNRRNHSRRSPSPRGRNSRRSSSPQDNYSRRSPRDLWRDNYIERNEDYLREEDYRRDAGYQLHNDYPQQDNYYQRGEDYRLDGYQDRMNQATQIVKFDHAIPESCVGLVIGRNGTEIQSISQKSQCKVQVNAEQNMSGYRMVEIFGQPENIERAKVLIDELVQRAALRHPAPMNYPVPQNPQPQVDHESNKNYN